MFHRNIKGFIVQGGDPSGTGKGGESVYGGFVADDFHPDLKYDADTVVFYFIVLLIYSYCIGTINGVFCLWQTMDQIRMVLNSLFAMLPNLI